MKVVQISQSDQENAFSMLAAVLWIGNINFSVIDNESHVTIDDKDGECHFLPLPNEQHGGR